ncbi:MAG TPA: phytanoyl-CoA dioxygenase family protein [Candidatus Binataceae bacterium]
MTIEQDIAPYIERFRRDGFVVVPDMLSGEELDHYRRAVDEAVARRKRGDHRKLAEKSLYEQSFIQCMNLWEDTPEVLPLTFHPRIGEAAARLLGVAGVRLWHDQALYKEAGGRETDPHQDQPYWPILETDEITAWIPFDGSTEETGCMGYVPGSHAVGLQKFVNIFTADQSENILNRPELKNVQPVWVEVPRGAIAFHHGLTVHLAKPNRSPRVRRVQTMIYFADGCTRGKKFQHFAVERPGIRVGEVIASDLTPMVWPRAAGDLPKPPDMPLVGKLARFLDTGAFPTTLKKGEGEGRER